MTILEIGGPFQTNVFVKGTLAEIAVFGRGINPMDAHGAIRLQEAVEMAEFFVEAWNKRANP
jgi:hypothetical protein